MMDCPYCGQPLEESSSSTEHIFPRSLGSVGLTVPVHERCQRRANQAADDRIRHCAPVQRARTELRIVDPSTGAVYPRKLRGTIVGRLPDHPAVAELLAGGDAVPPIAESQVGVGAPVTVRIGPDNDTSVVVHPKPLPMAGGGRCVVQLSDDQPSASTAESERAYFVVEASSNCLHERGAWDRFTAKVSLGLLYRASLLDHPAAEVCDAVYSAIGDDLREILWSDSNQPTSPNDNGEPSGLVTWPEPSLRHVLTIEHDDVGRPVVVLGVYSYLFRQLRLNCDLPVDQSTTVWFTPTIRAPRPTP